MIYSVFDWNADEKAGVYHYFEGPGNQRGIRPKPQRVVTDSKGQKLETLLPEVPAGSTRVGQGSTPRGRVAILNKELRGQLGENPLSEAPYLTLAIWVGAVYLAFQTATWLGQQAAK